ncbi:growth arrest and DNA damage-inducible protein GADD45 alpha-like [Gigantopelta aegis]|uniref:growth arrest and DNA damage-inducible protein GADD45 alpha-like n=1 Tax=Gigantopelta aegis TaxID=1735272 RepID=UPI001B88A303|nr:growth arrest and DNA damage-inducible protein GADD45 alpha-like [Gigantopelta aegis]
MTFPDVADGSVCHTKRTPLKVGWLLRESVRQALAENRLTCGVYECAKLLKCRADNVMLCVLPEAGNANDVTVHIKHTLIEAFCWENDIKLLKVTSSGSLANILQEKETAISYDHNDNATPTPPRTSAGFDVSCVLVEYPKLDKSEEDDAIADYYNTVLLGDVFPKPVIELPE